MSNNIPHTIHYCWFGGKPLPASVRKYISSWRKFFPGWEIKEWNESNFDVNAIPYTAEAYKAGKFAFVSDYARFWILFHYGGVYFDTDVEVIKSMAEIVDAGAFMGREKASTVAPGLGIGTPDGHPFYKEMLDHYAALKFSTDANIVDITTSMLETEGLRESNSIQQCAGMTIYPVDYFCPIDYETRKLKITDNTRAIHHYAESWLPWRTRAINAIGRTFPALVRLCVRIKKSLHR